MHLAHGKGPMDWFRSLPDYRRKVYLLLIVAILLTLPCYCIGLMLLALAPEGTAPPSSLPGGSGQLGEPPAVWATVPAPEFVRVRPLGADLQTAVWATMERRPPSKAGLGLRLTPVA